MKRKVKIQNKFHSSSERKGSSLKLVGKLWSRVVLEKKLERWLKKNSENQCRVDHKVGVIDCTMCLLIHLLSQTYLEQVVIEEPEMKLILVCILISHHSREN